MRKMTSNLMNSKMKNLTLTLFSAFMAVMLCAGSASAYEPKPAELGFQPPASPNMERLEHFHNDLLMWIITAITIFVMVLLLWVYYSCQILLFGAEFTRLWDARHGVRPKPEAFAQKDPDAINPKSALG